MHLILNFEINLLKCSGSRSFPENAYVATAINSTGFCTSARDAFIILAENVLRVATINSVGDFVLFLGKVRPRGVTLHRVMLKNLTCMLIFVISWTPGKVKSVCWAAPVPLCAFSDPDRVVHSVRRCTGAELPARVHGVGYAAHHRVCVRLPGGALLPVCVWNGGGRSLPLFRHRHQVQRRQPRQRILHGQSAHGKMFNMDTNLINLV